MRFWVISKRISNGKVIEKVRKIQCKSWRKAKHLRNE